MQLRRRIRFLPPERRAEVLEQLSQASSPGFDYFLLVVLSCSIATFGLITDSAAVIIGAMLVAPLMSPILDQIVIPPAVRAEVKDETSLAALTAAGDWIAVQAGKRLDRRPSRQDAFAVQLLREELDPVRAKLSFSRKNSPPTSS